MNPASETCDLCDVCLQCQIEKLQFQLEDKLEDIRLRDMLIDDLLQEVEFYRELNASLLQVDTGRSTRKSSESKK